MQKEIILKAIREYIFDKFPIQVLTVGAVANGKFSLNSTDVKVLVGTEESVTADMTGKSFEDLVVALIGGNVPIAFTASFRNDESIGSVIALNNAKMDSEIRVFQKTFYSDATILAFINKYLVSFLGYDETITTTERDALLEEISGRAYQHLCLYVAIMLVDYRRVWAYAQGIFDGSTFANGEGTDLGGVLNGDADSINVQIGEVFSLTDGEAFSDKYPTSDDGTSIGSENFFGDINSFWYRLFLWLRDKLEQGFDDFSFRKNNGMWSDAKLDRPLSYYQYFDSYPYSEQTRQIRNRLSQ